MKPQLLALLTAIAWGIGGFFEKKGMHLGKISPQLGITIRTAVALVLLAAISFPQWKSLAQTNTKALLYMIIGGGVVAGALGMFFFYAAIKGDSLSRIMPIAFTSPLFGAFLGIMFGSEPVTVKTIFGMVLTVSGIALLTTG